MATSERTSSASTPSRAAMYRISSVMIPARAQASCVLAPSTGAGRFHSSRIGDNPRSTSMTASVSVYGPRGVVDVEVFAVGEVDSTLRDAQVIDGEVVLRTSLDRSGGQT